MRDWQELYQEVILEHNRNPQNFGVIPAPDRVARGYNANCGDDICLFLKLSGDDIEEIKFSGEGCAIARASASLLTLAVEKLSKSRAQQKAEEMLALLTGKKQESDFATGLRCQLPLLGVRKFPMRIKCATLPWHALLEALAS
ncbi:MAG: SUF system NifU family Fe-S cluster assembly protein [Puniceicoccales bacterium]|jgi:nitrogen fixation NifU-like protein|nr:SUF system NifU family Fe-S cluster assembly protein [Puniceicoccales bacterium]